MREICFQDNWYNRIETHVLVESTIPSTGLDSIEYCFYSCTVEENTQDQQIIAYFNILMF